jgi:hypothetical protein
MYKLTYWIGNRNIETVLISAPKNVCKWKKNCLTESTHKMGTFKIEKI